jgi:hypothetical protein
VGGNGWPAYRRHRSRSYLPMTTACSATSRNLRSRTNRHEAAVGVTADSSRSWPRIRERRFESARAAGCRCAGTTPRRPGERARSRARSAGRPGRVRRCPEIGEVGSGQTAALARRWASSGTGARGDVRLTADWAPPVQLPYIPFDTCVIDAPVPRSRVAQPRSLLCSHYCRSSVAFIRSLTCSTAMPGAVDSRTPTAAVV